MPARKVMVLLLISVVWFVDTSQGAVHVNPGNVGDTRSPGTFFMNAYMDESAWSGNTIDFVFTDSKHIEFSPGTYNGFFGYANVVTVNTQVASFLLDEFGDRIAGTGALGVVGSNTSGLGSFSLSSTVIAHGVRITFLAEPGGNLSTPGTIALSAQISAPPQGLMRVGMSQSTLVPNGDPEAISFNGFDVLQVGGALVDLPTVNESDVLQVMYNVSSVAPEALPDGFSVAGSRLQSWEINFNNEAFDGTAVVRLVYDESLLGGIEESELRVLHTFSDGSGYEFLNPTSIDTVNNVLVVEMDRFSTLSLGTLNQVASVPEPGSCLALGGLLLSFGTFGFLRRRRGLSPGA